MAKHPSFTDFAKGTVLSEANVEVVGSTFTMWDYRGKADPSPALMLTLKTPDGSVYEQYYSVGDAREYAPTKDGKSIDILGTREKIHEQSNFAKLMESLFRSGLPARAVNNEDIGSLVGIHGHMRQETIKRGGGGNVQAESTLLLFDKVESLPGEAKSAGGGAAGAADDEVTGIATDTMVDILGENPDGIARKSLLTTAMKMASVKELDKAQRTAVLALIKQDDFITGSELWVEDKGVVVLA